MNWSAIGQLMRLPNQSGTWLLMLPTLWALVAASGGRPSPRLVLIFATGAFLMRSLGVVLNDLLDRSIDRQVRRTQGRPLASGVLHPGTALAVAAALIALAASLLLFLNWFTVLLSPIALVLAALYPLSKRVMHLPQAVLGAAFGWGVVMAWAAARNALDHPVWLLFAATVCWAIVYDTIYALQDRADDERIGVRSAAILFGSWTWLAVGLASLTMLVCLGYSGWIMGVGWPFYLVLAGLLGFLAWQTGKIRGGLSPRQAFALFKQHVWAGWAVLGGFLLGFYA